MLEKTLESPLDNKEIQSFNPKRNQSWIFIGRTNSEAEAPMLWAPNAKNWLIGKDPDVGKDWRQEEKGMTEEEMVRWHHLLNGHESEQTPGDSERQGSLECCSPWGHKGLDMTEWLNSSSKFTGWGALFCLYYGEVCLFGDFFSLYYNDIENKFLKCVLLYSLSI